MGWVRGPARSCLSFVGSKPKIDDKTSLGTLAVKSPGMTGDQKELPTVATDLCIEFPTDLCQIINRHILRTSCPITGSALRKAKHVINIMS